MKLQCGDFLFCIIFIIVIVSLVLYTKKRQSGQDYTHESITKPFDPDDITTYPTTKEIFKSGRFTASERRNEYIRRGKSPSGVIDGEYNDTYLDDGEVYNDMDRDWDADA